MIGQTPSQWVLGMSYAAIVISTVSIALTIVGRRRLAQFGTVVRIVPKSVSDSEHRCRTCGALESAWDFDERPEELP